MSIFLALLGNRWGQMIAVALAAYFYGWWSVPRVDVAAVRRDAIEARDAHWKTVLAEKERENETRVAAAKAAAEAEPPTPSDRTERLRLCRQSPTCRDKDGG